MHLKLNSISVDPPAPPSNPSGCLFYSLILHLLYVGFSFIIVMIEVEVIRPSVLTAKCVMFRDLDE